jgi:uncharacterized DUF497 family protein
MLFEWDIEKERINRAKHGVGFHTAEQVFDDPLALPRPDRIVDGEERWWTVGETHAGSLLVVVHTYRQQVDSDVVRIISARKADRHERRAYEAGH